MFLRALLFIGLLISCVKEKPYKSILRISLKSPLSHLDPARTYDHVHNQVGYQVYESLLEYDPNSNENQLRVLLADGMPIWSNDNLRLTFKIKSGVRYHSHEYISSNREVKAQDFITQIKRVAFAPTQSPGLWMIESKIVGVKEFRSKTKTLDDLFKNSIEGLKALDDQTLQIDLIRADKSLIYFFSMIFSSPIPEEFLRENGNDFLNQMIGTGPYEVSAWRPKSLIKLEKSASYYKRYNNPEEIYFYIMPEDQTRWLNFKQGKLDIIEIANSNLSQVFTEKGKLLDAYKEKRFQFLKKNSLSYWWLGFNMSHPFWGEKKEIRKAICHSIDRKRYNNLFYRLKGQVANHLLPPGVNGHRQNDSWCAYNPSLAKSILKSAGYENGKDIPELIFDTRSNSIEHRQKAEFIKIELAKVGIKVKLRLNAFSEFMSKSKKGEMAFWQDGWIMDYPSADNSLQLLTSWNKYPGSNKSGFSNKRIDNLYEEILLSSSRDEKQKYIDEFSNHIKEEMPWIMMSYAQNLILAQPRVKKLYYSELMNNFYKYIELKEGQ